MKSIFLSGVIFSLFIIQLFSSEDVFDAGVKDDSNKQINLMWSTFGRAENVRLTKFGNSPAWFEWMALKHCWSDTPELRQRLKNFLIDWPQANDGYMWTWGTEEGWPTHHIRHNENNGKYILAVYRFYCWQGGKKFLQTRDPEYRKSKMENQSDQSKGLTVLEKTRAAMEYQLKFLKGEEGLAIVTDPKCDGTVDGMPSDYWDNFRFGYKSAYMNIYFYASLLAMAELEKSIGNTTRATELEDLAQKVKINFTQTFWDKEKGRFIGCIDVNGRKWDFGFTYLNLEAVFYGLASEAQAKSIYNWLDGKKIIKSDKQKVGKRMTGATGKEIYHLKWAPLSTTRAVESIVVDGKCWWWHLGNKITVNGKRPNSSYGEHVENGGAIFYVSFYDLMSRLKTFGPDNAWKRFESILSEFRKDQLKRDPKNNRGAAWKWGIIGEFPESGLVPTFIPLGLMGLDATPDALVVKPRLPKSMEWLEAKHVSYKNGIYSIRTDGKSITLKTIKKSDNPVRIKSYEGTLYSAPAEGNQITFK